MKDLSLQAEYVAAREALLSVENDSDVVSKETIQAYERFKTAAINVLEAFDLSQVVARYVEERFPPNSMAPDKIEKAKRAIEDSREKLREVLNDSENRSMFILDYVPSIWDGLLKDILRCQ